MFESDNLIYNRFDSIHVGGYKSISFSTVSEQYDFQYYRDDYKAFINVWGKRFPQDVFDQAIDYIFSNECGVDKIEIQSGGNNYRDMLDEVTDVVLEINHGTAPIADRIKAKGRYNLKRERSQMESDHGITRIEIENSPLSDETIEMYFGWKERTHGRDYHLTASDYVKKYHVTDVMKLFAGNRCVSMVLYCKVEDTVYIENLGYDIEFSSYSPGTLVYYNFLTEMEKEGVNYVFLGKSGLEYKKRFDSKEYVRYSGIIYRDEVFQRIRDYFGENSIQSCSIYGLGWGAKKFWSVRNLLEIDVLFGVDRDVKEFNGISVITPEELPQKNQADIMIITIVKRDQDIERIMNEKGYRYIYLFQLLDGIGCTSGADKGYI